MGTVPQLSVLRGEFLEASSAVPPLLHRLLEATAASSSEADTALVHGDVHASLRALDAAASRLARAMVRRVRSAGARPNTDGDWIVGVDMEPSVELVTTLLAAWKAGAAYMPVGPGFPAARVAHIVHEARPVLVVADAVNADVQHLCHSVSFSELQRESEELSTEPLEDHETLGGTCPIMALVFYTSGSTGIPKGVRLSHATVLNRLRWQWRQFPFSAGEVCAFKTALSFVDSVAELWAPMLRGHAVVVVPRDVTRDPHRLALLLHHHKVERLVLVPSLLRALLLIMDMQMDPGMLQHLRLWVCSGEPLAADLARLFFRRFPSHSLANFYGSTEVMGDVTYHVLRSAHDAEALERVPIGVPVANTLVYVVDAHFRPVLAGETGELLVAGRNLAAGYVASRDAHRFVDNPLAVDGEYSRLYRTGDYVRVVKGVIEYEGRTDSQVKVRGHRVDLSEVEKAVNGIAGVEKGVVLCYKPGELNQAIVAFVTTNPSSQLLATNIQNTLQMYLAPYMMPQVILIDNIPLLVNGKTDRQQLLRSYEENYINVSNDGRKADIDYTGVPDKKMDAAITLFETVALVLGNSVKSKLSIQSNFYELGGNSLNSVYTVTRLRDQGYIIGITDFISAKNMSEVLDRMHYGDENILSIADQAPNYKYIAKMLHNSHKDIVARMVTSSFYEKADLEQWLMPVIARDDYKILIDNMWEPLVAKNLSFVVQSSDGNIVGVGLNFDAHDEPVVEINSKLVIVFDFLDFLEGPIRNERLPQGKGQVLHSFMMATHESLNYQQNVEVIQFMEEEVMRLARSKGFAGIFTTNTSPLTQQLGTDIYDYKVLLDFQVNNYVAPDGSKPFHEAPDTQRAICSWRPV